jgi:hypothetical protein
VADGDHGLLLDGAGELLDQACLADPRLAADERALHPS